MQRYTHAYIHTSLATLCSWQETQILPHWLTDQHMDGWRWLVACRDQWRVCTVCVHHALICPHVTSMNGRRADWFCLQASRQAALSPPLLLTDSWTHVSFSPVVTPSIPYTFFTHMLTDRISLFYPPCNSVLRYLLKFKSSKWDVENKPEKGLFMMT